MNRKDTRYWSFLLLLFTLLNTLGAQENPNPLPKHLTATERALLESGTYRPPLQRRSGLTDPPDFPTRTLGEWEELSAIVITWDAYYSVLREIVRYAKEEVEVINICEDSLAIQSYLANNGIDLERLTFIEAPFNTVWVRDYGPNPVYQNDVDSLVLIDWIYNRPRPRDDRIPDLIGDYLDVPVYSTTQAPNDLVHTGGNFMSDGLGTGFSSRLLLDENDFNSPFGTSNHSEADVDNLMDLFMGIEAYPKMEVLPYDGINHIDMHMKLLDEQTLLIGEFPTGISDGPQIEANIQYVLDNYQTHWGTDFKIERIVQPPCGNGNYPPSCQGGQFSAEYRTYTNALFVNQTVLVPIYNTALDEQALARWRELLPGYKIRGIDCTQIINAGGAIHCITKEIGVKDPLWIAHRGLDDLNAIDNAADYRVEASIKHRSGIARATLYWTTDTTAGYQTLPMQLEDAERDLWVAQIPQQANGAQVFYYFEAEARSGKRITRPLPAPAGYFEFLIEPEVTSGLAAGSLPGVHLVKTYPNPASATTVFEVEASRVENVELILSDILGREAAVIFSGQTKMGQNQYFIEASNYPAGAYWVQLLTQEGLQIHKLIIK